MDEDVVFALIVVKDPKTAEQLCAIIFLLGLRTRARKYSKPSNVEATITRVLETGTNQQRIHC